MIPGIRDPHLARIRPVRVRTRQGCEECLSLGTAWVHLRLCLTCGHVGCCDSSPMRHARAHATELHPTFVPWNPARIGAGAIPMRHSSRILAGGTN